MTEDDSHVQISFKAKSFAVNHLAKRTERTPIAKKTVVKKAVNQTIYIDLCILKTEYICTKKFKKGKKE